MEKTQPTKRRVVEPGLKRYIDSTALVPKAQGSLLTVEAETL